MNLDLLKLNLQLFAEEGEGSGDSAPLTEGEQQTGDKPEDTKTFTQDDVNAIAAREKKQATERLLKELGIEDFENAKDGMKKFQEWQESQKTEAERQSEKLTNLEKSHADVQAENLSLKAQLSALSHGVKTDSVEDVVALAERLVTEETSMDDAIKQVTEKYPHFKQEQEEVSNKPRFLGDSHTSSEKDSDAFEALMNKYK